MKALCFCTRPLETEMQYVRVTCVALPQFANSNNTASKDSEFFINFNHTGTLAFRILWRYYLRSTFNELTQMQVTTELAKYLTVRNQNIRVLTNVC